MSADEAVTDVEAVNEGEPVQGRPLTPAERAARFRERQKRKLATLTAEAPDPAGITTETAGHAIATIAAQLDRIIKQRRIQDDSYVAAFREAVDALTDADRVAAALAAAQTSAATAVAASAAREAEIENRCATAEAATREAKQQAAEAGAAAEEFARQVDDLTKQLEDAKAWAEAAKDGWEAEQAGRADDARRHAEELDAVRADRREALEVLVAEHNQAVEALRDEYSEAVGRLQAEHAAVVDELRARATAADRRADSLEGVLANRTAEVEHVHGELARLRDDQPRLIEEARDEVHTTMAARHAAELEAAAARHEGAIASVTGKLEACESRREALNDLLKDLRSR